MIDPMFADFVHLSLSPVGGYGLVALVGAVLVALLWLGPAQSRTTPARRRALVTLRLLVVSLVLAAMLKPTVVWTTIVRQASTLILLIDGSRSMQVTDTVGNRSRWEAMRAALDEAGDALGDLDEHLEIKAYVFDSKPRRLAIKQGKISLAKLPKGDQTAIGAALDDVRKREAGKRLAWLILLGDGAQRANAPLDAPPQLSARSLVDQGAKLHTVVFGQARGPGQARDVALDELLATSPVFVKNQLVVTGSARIDGYVNQGFPVQLLVETARGKMSPAGTRRIEAKQDGQRVPLEFEYVPQVPGEIKISLRAPPQPGELISTNNEMSTFITVRKGGLNVLYLNGSIQPEQKFLRWALASPDIKVDYFHIRADKKETRPANLKERFRPGKYDVYLFGDLDSSVFSKAELAQLSQTVETGAGFMMLGGLFSFGAGGYGQTPLADVLPIRMDRLERQSAGEPIRSDLHLAGRLPMRPTRDGAAQSLMRLAALEKNDSEWARLPPLEGANHFARLKAGAITLAATPAGAPLLVTRDYGNGRVLAFAGDSTWHWWMDGHEAAHRRFWRQVVLWLARKDETTEGKVWIKLDQRRYAPGTRVELSAGAESAHGEPLTGAQFEAHVVRPDKKKVPLRLRRDGKGMLASFVDTRLPGDYTLVVNATHERQPVGEARARFLVFDSDLELANPAADLGTMSSLATLTGGKAVAPEQLPNLLAEIERESRQFDVETQVTRTLWDTWWFFLAFLGLLTAEWFLRKKWGLV